MRYSRSSSTSEKQSNPSGRRRRVREGSF
jgi:hypothetical protein